MIIQRTEHPDWLTNAYLVADGPGGSGVVMDANADLGPLLAQVDRDGITITHILLTHHHADHVADIERYRERFDVRVVAHADTAAVLGEGRWTRSSPMAPSSARVIWRSRRSTRRATAPGTSRSSSYMIASRPMSSFRGTVGGTASPGGNYANLQRSVMERLMALPPETRVHPGNREPTTIGDEWESNPFVRLWRGLDSEGSEAVHVREDPATLLLWAPDYDGGNKALVEYPDGRRAIVGGSQIVR